MTARNIKQDAARLLDVVEGGGIAIVGLDVGYAIMGHTEPAIRRIFEAKQRSYGKPCGFFSSWELLNEIYVIGERERRMVSVVIHDYNLPLSVVAPFRRNHPIYRKFAPFVLENASKAGTQDMLLNAGEFHDELARQSRARLVAVLGSSANLSLTGSKFRLEDVESPVRAAADLVLDYGLCKYHNRDGLGSTIIDLTNFDTIRAGICYDEICKIFRNHFDVDLKALAAHRQSSQTSAAAHS